MPQILPDRKQIESFDPFTASEEDIRSIIASSEYEDYLRDLDMQAEEDAARAAEMFDREWRQDGVESVYADLPF